MNLNLLKQNQQMYQQQHKYKFIISGGGTGGHIFPALAIAEELKLRYPHAAFHFVGATGRMEMEKIPQHGYTITGLPIVGLNRQQKLKNLAFPFKLAKSIAICRFLLRDRKPDVVIGTGGFASGPLLWQAQRYNIPTVIQEQNSYPGITNKLLAKKANAICVAYNGLDRWFPVEKTYLTGNPVRQSITQNLPDKKTSAESFGLQPEKPVILVLGGSLGARAINAAVANQLQTLLGEDAQLIWQCGRLYQDEYVSQTNNRVKVSAFIGDMNLAYAAADIIISRAGAGTISELCLAGKPAILVPSPNVAEDHQTHNARALSEVNAALLLPESELNNLAVTVWELLQNKEKANKLSQNIRLLALPEATQHIVDQIEKLLPR